MASTNLTETDSAWLRRAIERAVAAAALGNRPFGAVVTGADGQLLSEGENHNTSSGDCTAHAEVAALREASLRHGRAALAGGTIYASGEPCVMCAGAIFWSGIRRVVFGIDALSLRRFRASQAGAADLQMSCREVFASSAEPFTVIGPALLDEASAPHRSYWKM